MMKTIRPTSNLFLVLGHHHVQMRKFKKEWNQFPFGERIEKGSQVFDKLLSRNEKFYFSTHLFDLDCESTLKTMVMLSE